MLLVSHSTAELIAFSQNRQIDTTFIEQSSPTPSTSYRRHSLNVEHGGDSGIDSVQASPSPIAQQSNQPIIITSSSTLKQSSCSSPTPSERQQQQRQLLHPDHARTIRPPTSPDNVNCFKLLLKYCNEDKLLSILELA